MKLSLLQTAYVVDLVRDTLNTLQDEARNNGVEIDNLEMIKEYLHTELMKKLF